jgi:hypothetical protein
MAKGNTPLAPSGVATAAQLMGTADQLAIPRLDGVSLQYHYSAGDWASIALARTLVQLDLAAPEDWEAANRDPGAYVLMTLDRWIAAHGGQAISRRFDLYTTLSSCLDEYSARLTSHPEGFAGLWSRLADSQDLFPTQFLTDAKQTLRQFVETGEEQ